MKQINLLDSLNWVLTTMTEA